MAYSFQTFSVGQVLTAGQMNQVEVNIRDHQHGVAGVTGSGMTFASPVFTTQITTPQIVTASGNLTITPAGNADIILQGSGTGNVGIGVVPYTKLSVNGIVAIGSAITSAGLIYKSGTNLYFENSDDTGTSGNSQLIFRVRTNGTPIVAMGINHLGNVGIGTPTPTAVLHLKAGTAAANTGPFKMTSSGTGIIGLLTTPEKGSMEFSDYGLWFTPAASTRHKVWAGLIGATAPGTNAIGTIADYFGTSATRVLTTPNTWVSIIGDDGATYKVPAYS